MLYVAICCSVVPVIVSSILRSLQGQRMDWVSRAINGREEGGEEGEGQEGQEGGGAKSNNIRKYQKSL